MPDVTEQGRDVLITGLKNMYATETQALDMTQNQRDRLDAYPQLKARIGRHAEETRGQLQRIEQCLSQFNASPSSFKDLAMRTVGNVQNWMHAMADDEVLKGTFAATAFEHYEIAAYKSLIAMAEALGEKGVADVCRENLREEEDMARWLDEHIDSVTQQYLQKEGVQGVHVA